jgi:hypothetical protein
MYCNQIAFCTRYFPNGESDIEAAFLVVNADAHEIQLAFAKYNVNEFDFRIFLDAKQNGWLDNHQLLISTDGKYASIMMKSGDENIEMYGTHFRDISVGGGTIEALLDNFQKLLLQHETLFREPGVRLAEYKIKNRIKYGQVAWEENQFRIFQEVEWAATNPEQAPIDILALAIFQSGLNTEPEGRYVDPAPLMRELWNRIEKPRNEKYSFFDFTGITPREIMARRARAEATLKELELINREFNYDDDYRRLENAIKKIKGDLLAETAFLSAVRRSPVQKLLFWAVYNTALHANRRIIY